MLPFLLLAACSDYFKVSVVDDDGDGLPAGKDCNDNDASVGAETSTFYSDSDEDGFGDPNSSTQLCRVQDGFVTDATDCADSNAAVHPGAAETCNGLDDNCDDLTDDADPSVTGTSLWYADIDGDGFGDLSATLYACSQPEGYVDVAGDCDDLDPTIFPNAEELPDGIDNNCDGVADEGLPTTTYYTDLDGDGFGDNDTAADLSYDPGEGFVVVGGDCDDARADIHPGAPETDCSDPTDYNCDGSTGSDDRDGDASIACEDCNDGDATVYPGALEYCDDVDHDCDGSVNEDESVDATAWYADDDRDGYGDPLDSALGCSLTSTYPTSDSTDCNDTTATINPGADELCSTAGDDNCNGVVNESTAVDVSTWYADADGDGYGDSTDSIEDCEQPDGYVANADDCDDGDATLNPETIWYADVDGDGFGDSTDFVTGCPTGDYVVSNGDDINDANATIYPDAPELCDGLDNDGDTLIDEDISYVTYYLDSDGDGYGADSTAVVDCAIPVGAYVTVGGDSDDANPAVNPGETEVCNGIDDDSDGTVDESDAADALTWYADTDEDGYGDALTSLRACTAPVGFVSNTSDYDDTDDSVNILTWYADDDADGYGDLTSFVTSEDTGSFVMPSGYVDNAGDYDDTDFSVNVLTWYADADGDGYGNSSSFVTSEDTGSFVMPSGYVTNAADCNDGRASINPLAAETCNSTDDDCDGLVDDADPDRTGGSTWYADADGDTYGDPTVSTVSCVSAPSTVSDSTDCDDTRRAVNPAAVETCNSIDDDCDRFADDADPSVTGTTAWYVDADGDSYGAATPTYACAAPSGSVEDGTDCDDGDDTTYPGASDVPLDGIVNNCLSSAITEGPYAVADIEASNLEGYAASQYLGLGARPLAAVSDVTGDGFAELLVGAAYTSSSTGIAYLIEGGTNYSGNILSNAFASYTGEASSNFAGYTVGSVGDLDDDGTDDFAVGAFNYSSRTGRVYVESGSSITSGSQSLSAANIILTGSASTYFGYSFDRGDFNADGFEDIAVGSPYSSGLSIFLGPLSAGSYASSAADYSLSGYASAETGIAVAMNGDSNGDGYDDVLVASDKANSNAGQVDVIQGTSSLTATTLATARTIAIQGATANDYLANDVAYLPDVVGDGNPEIVLGNSSYSGSSTDDGAVFVFASDGLSAGTYTSTSADVMLEGVAASDNFGSGVATGNLDGDSYGDLFVGWQQSDEGSSDSGAAILAYGLNLFSLSSPLSTDQEGVVRVWGGAAGDRFGSSAAFWDYDGDGVDEPVVGAKQYDVSSYTDAGAISILENNQ